ncbi:hypothetical protein [Pseudomonas sp. Hp2]|uniref:hypothetical protein n=1 Tax=Pseudomonas sp. Hp2 TaxID=701189 RepID=UPI00112A9267|nr:hypothetical protein [Pseudomonas sp. Hp2]
MTATPPSEPSVTPAALSAFLRGVERRGFVVALLQGGDGALAERALAAAQRAFRNHANEELMAAWPVRFWSLLSATPGLRHAHAGTWPEPLAALATATPEDRLALLLRIVAGLDEPMASDVLGVSEDDYRAALGRACPRDAAGQPDAAAWRALAEAAQARVRDLAPEQLERLVRLREAALAGTPAMAATDTRAPARRAPAPGRAEPRRGQVPRGRTGWAVAAIVVVLAGLAALGGWWWWQRQAPVLPPEPASQALPGALHVVDAGPVLVEELPADDDRPASEAVSAIDPADAAMLADPELGLARQADFYAWAAAGGPVPADESEARPVAGEPASAGLETVDDEN